MTEPVSQPAQGPDERQQASASALLVRLREALAVPRDARPPAWEDETGRLIALISVDFVQQTDEATALQELALVHLAAARGNKSAKKRALNAGRWAQKEPPSITQVLVDADELRAGVKALVPLRASWVPDYVVTELTKPGSAPARDDLVEWGIRNASDLATFISMLAARANATQRKGWLAETAAVALKPDRLSKVSMGPGFLVAIADLLGEFAPETAATDEGDEALTARAALRVASVEALDIATAAMPSLLLQPAVARIVTAAMTPVPKPPASLLGRVAQISRRASDLLSWISIHGESAARAAARQTAAALFDALKANPSYADVCAAFRAIVDEDSPAADGTCAAAMARSSELERAISSLLVQWSEIAAPDMSDELRQIGEQIDLVAQLMSVQRDGEPGAVVNYEPLRQHLSQPAVPPPLRVRVLKPGVKVTRDDGTERILLKALVAPLPEATA